MEEPTTGPPPASSRNRWAFAVGTFGRDMVYTLLSMFLVVYLTEVIDLPDATMWWLNGILLAARLLDAATDLVMGAIVDNTRTRWGAYKPWIAGGAVASAALTVLLFTDPGLRGPGYAAAFAVVYLAWGLAFTANDIPYWSLLPALTLDRGERESIAALAKVFATLGLFSVVVTIIPVTAALGGDAPAWTAYVAVVVVVMLVFQCVTLFGVRQQALVVPQPRTSLRELGSVVARNDQLLWTALAMTLLMTGFLTTAAFGVYFFKYVHGDESLYSPFAAVAGLGQLIGFALFGPARRRLGRPGLFNLGTALMVTGYVVFLASPMSLVAVGAAGLVLFAGQAIVTIVMLGSISDCIEYGHWKLGRRNGAVTFALQPFINKVSGALATAVVGTTVILTGINAAPTPADVSPRGLAGIRVMMLVVPLVLVLVAHVVHRARFRIDDEFHASIVRELGERGQLTGPD